VSSTTTTLTSSNLAPLAAAYDEVPGLSAREFQAIVFPLESVIFCASNQSDIVALFAA